MRIITGTEAKTLREAATGGPWWTERKAVGYVLPSGQHPGYTCEATFVMPQRWQIYGDDWRHDGVLDAKGSDYHCANARIIAAAPDLAFTVETLEADRDRWIKNASDLARDFVALEAERDRLRAYLDTLPDEGAASDQLDAICSLAHGRTDHPLVVAALQEPKP